MKRWMKIALVLALVAPLVACGEKRLTEEDVKNAEKALFENGMTPNMDTVPYVVDVFCRYVEENPMAPTAPEWLFKALEISVNMLPAERSIEIGSKLMEDYPDFDKTPIALFMLASMVYEDKVGDLDKARDLYERLVADYPDNEFVPSAQQAIKHLGKTPEELVREFELMMDTIQFSEELDF